MPWRCRRFRLMPAVSTRTKVRSPRSKIVSIESRVVPGVAETMTRSAAEDRVQKRRLPDVRPAEDRDADRFLRNLGSARSRQPVDDQVEQVAGAVAVQSRDRNRIAEPEPVQVERQALLARVVDLVGDQEHRLARAAKDVGDLFVPRAHACLGVDDEEHEIGLRDRLLRLHGDRLRHRRLVGDVDAARVDQQEALAVPVGDELLAVAGHARRLVDHRSTRAGEPVHERRLADVREADDRHGPDQRGLHCLAHLGGIATRGRPCSCVSTRNSQRRRSSCWMSSAAAR